MRFDGECFFEFFKGEMVKGERGDTGGEVAAVTENWEHLWDSGIRHIIDMHE